MNDEELKQRIRYLVEHGGLYDDPLADIRRKVTILSYLVGVALTLNVLHFVIRVT